ncbi:sensor histidine kinase [Syntrophomonas palmitatica]|uniref:sensor histidine kinase n=1 Tax=Syntrophomonas palmitatica TaxID=402877 RepID=UPI0006D24D93|nr:ATP-binding protein [Syntrophomonas palmitatica]
MYETAPWIALIHGFATGFICTWLGLILVNIRPSLIKIGLLAVCFAIVNTLVRSLNMPFGIDFFIMTAFQVILVMFYWNLNLLRSFVSVVLGVLILLVGEALNLSLMFNVFDINMQALTYNRLILLIFPLPQIAAALIIIAIIYKYDFHLFDFHDQVLHESFYSNEKRVKNIMVLAAVMFFLIIVQIVFNVSIFNLYPHPFLKNLPARDIGLITSTAMATAFIVLVIIIEQLFVLLQTESDYINQSAYMQTLDELYTASRAEAHDRINHLQTLYGFVQLGYLDETRSYLEELMGDMVISQNYYATGHQALSALFYIKSGLAISKGIQLEISTDTRIEHMDIPAHEINRIIGNLINNALDFVSSLEKNLRKVIIYITADDRFFIFKISNHGNLDANMFQKIFEKNFTTKSGQHQGLGLYIVKKLVDKHNGTIQVNNQDNMVVFTVQIPKSSGGGDNYEYHSQDYSAPLGGRCDRAN